MVDLKAMKKNQKILLAGLAVVVLGAVAIVLIVALSKDAEVDSVTQMDTLVQLDNGDAKIDWSKYTTYTVELSDSLHITQPGVYQLSGTIADGNISIDVTDCVKLVLDGVKITNSDGPAIFVENAEDVVIFTTSGTKNYLEDGATYDSATYADDEIGVIFSHDDLTLEGGGILVVKSNNEDAIVGKDDLKINGGTYEIEAVDDGIRGKDSVYIVDGDFVIGAGGDGIKSTDTTDSMKGFVYVVDGQFEITAGFDGVQAETKLLIEGGDWTIETGGGSGNASDTTTEWGAWSHPGMNGGSMGGGATSTVSVTSDSAKGLKAGSNIVVYGGIFELDCSDDALHSNQDVGIKDGTFTISTGDDAVHADRNLVIDGGKMTITKSYEGLEGTTVTVNGGEIALVASDDGINAAGGSDASSMSATGRPGANRFSADSDVYIKITGGEIVVDATGDGIDSNGNIYIDGGDITVYGPTNSADGALDYDGSLTMTGGVLIAGGASGMAQGASGSGGINSVMIFFSSTMSSKDQVEIVDSDGATVASYQSEKSYNSLIVATDALRTGTTYTIMVNGEKYDSFVAASGSTQVGSGGMMTPGMNGNMPSKGGAGRR